jgi:hypothetical protein
MDIDLAPQNETRVYVISKQVEWRIFTQMYSAHHKLPSYIRCDNTAYTPATLHIYLPI